MASQRSSRRSRAAALSSWLRWMLPCSRATTSASSLQSLGTRQRSQTCSSRRALRCSWPIWRGSTSAGVLPLPKSWQRQAKRTDSGACKRADMSSTIMACMPQSISGWYSARWGTPQSLSSSGSSRARAPHSRSMSNMREGWGSIRPRLISCHTRSGTRASTSPAATISRMSSMVSGATEKSVKRAAKRARRRMRTGSSRKASVTWRSTRSLRSCWPW
ncbi:hypothetical protein SDC9_138986 [bioreactor metagenome]|uniref:Uncharacterized protein n=1 Tax=bioreactor metagenome TaxID=1076179 RepID=A0A645DTU1_9ZZZZ